MSKGGCVILGDWHLESCRAAVYDFVRNNKLNVLISELFKGHLADAHFFMCARHGTHLGGESPLQARQREL